MKVPKYKQWLIIFKSIKNSKLQQSDYSEIIQYDLSSIEIINSYDVISETLSLFGGSITIDDVSGMQYLDTTPENLTTDSFKSIISICLILFLILKLTVGKYFKYKQNNQIINQDIVELVHKLCPSNYHQLIPELKTLQLQLLTFNHNLLELITIISQQNPKSYISFEKLFQVISDLSIYFQSNQQDTYFNKVKIACIESSLIEDNFNYAYTQTMQLFPMCKDWIIFYQVGKYISPDWDTAPLYILIKQREILGLILEHFDENFKMVLDQWDRINSQIEQYQVGQQVSREVGRDVISNLLVSGLGWAIGAKNFAFHIDFRQFVKIFDSAVNIITLIKAFILQLSSLGAIINHIGDI
ncbi:hypothetical protein JA1_005328 [Spathaspora sp. JA1]|nr:hypothetical protein JA1_005328 [Spathaspora sp. JA1]